MLYPTNTTECIPCISLLAKISNFCVDIARCRKLCNRKLHGKEYYVIITATCLLQQLLHRYLHKCITLKYNFGICISQSGCFRWRKSRKINKWNFSLRKHIHWLSYTSTCVSRNCINSRRTICMLIIQEFHYNVRLLFNSRFTVCSQRSLTFLKISRYDMDCFIL